MKEKYIRHNQTPFMNKGVRKAIMNRTYLLNRFRKENSFINKLAYKKGNAILVLNLLRRQKGTFIITLT